MKVFWCLALLTWVTISTVSTFPRPENFFKKLERMGQRVRDAIISAGPAVDVLMKAKQLDSGDIQKAIELSEATSCECKRPE